MPESEITVVMLVALKRGMAALSFMAAIFSTSDFLVHELCKNKITTTNKAVVILNILLNFGILFCSE
jgi:hypothetical protein